jgi:hypothetical protein
MRNEDWGRELSWWVILIEGKSQLCLGLDRDLTYYHVFFVPRIFREKAYSLYHLSFMGDIIYVHIAFIDS